VYAMVEWNFRNNSLTSSLPCCYCSHPRAHKARPVSRQTLFSRSRTLSAKDRAAKRASGMLTPKGLFVEAHSNPHPTRRRSRVLHICAAAHGRSLFDFR
jgi:hypothetical protein